MPQLQVEVWDPGWPRRTAPVLWVFLGVAPVVFLELERGQRVGAERGLPVAGVSGTMPAPPRDRRVSAVGERPAPLSAGGRAEPLRTCHAGVTPVEPEPGVTSGY